MSEIWAMSTYTVLLGGQKSRAHLGATLGSIVTFNHFHLTHKRDNLTQISVNG